MDSKLYISKGQDDIRPQDLQKMKFLFNALQDGWEIKMKNNKYHFTKKHENKQEIYLDSYLSEFITKNMDL
tara:strand:+ start:5080 stop:5292 length:213 start_codon:yes stop_codon:yes gene_type:complete